MVASYGLVVAALGATRLTQRGVPWIIGAHLGLPLLTWLVTRASHSVVGRVLRASYPVVLLAGLYSAIDVMNGFGAATTWDAPLQAADAWLFHGQPSRDWWRAAPSVFWSTLLHGVYFSYYILVPLPVIVFLAQRRPAALERYLDGLIATFLLCYVTYLLLDPTMSSRGQPAPSSTTRRRGLSMPRSPGGARSVPRFPRRMLPRPSPPLSVPGSARADSAWRWPCPPRCWPSAWSTARCTTSSTARRACCLV